MIESAEQTFELPTTVRAYLTDPAIRVGVDALLGVKSGSLPPDLQFSELSDYYAAQAAAELTRYDWAAALHRLWSLTWEAALAPMWKPVSIEEAAAYDIAVTPTACWTDDSFSFYHRHGIHKLFTSVFFDTDETHIAFSLETEDEVLMEEDCCGFVWRSDDDWNGWLVMTAPASPVGQDFPLAELALSAAAAVASANERIRI